MTDDAKAKAREFLSKTALSILSTVDGKTPYSRVMMTAKVDDDFAVWFTTSAKSNKVRHIKDAPMACAIFSEGWKYLRVIGKADVITDKATKASMWKDMYAQYWPKGADDPDYVLIRISPDQVQYFDTEKAMEPVILNK